MKHKGSVRKTMKKYSKGNSPEKNISKGGVPKSSVGSQVAKILLDFPNAVSLMTINSVVLGRWSLFLPCGS